MNFFHSCFSEQQIKARYRDLCKVHHPDLGGSEDMMKAVNAAYEERLRGEFSKSMDPDQTEATIDLEKEVAAKVAEIIGLQGIIIELVGRWVWVTGETYKAKAALKAAGFWWASKKFAWYWHKPEDACRGGKKTLEEIRKSYGSTVLTSVRGTRLTA